MGMISGSFMNLGLPEHEVVMMGSMSALVPKSGGCMSAVSMGSFSAPVDPFMAGREIRPQISDDLKERLHRGRLAGSNGGSNGGVMFAAGPIDAGPIDAAPPGDGATAGCSASPSYGSVTFDDMNQAASFGDNGGTSATGYHTSWVGLVGEGPSQSLLQIELWSGYGALAGMTTPQPGTYTIAGEDTSYATCGVCVLMLSELTMNPMGGLDAGELYFATSGTVTLGSLSGGP
jgi:hypothetical protein